MGKMFKHNEKTDFILNMTHKGYQKLEFWFLAAAAAGISLSFLPYYVKRGTGAVNGGLEVAVESVTRNSDALKALKYAPVVLMAFGFFGFLMLLIAGIKKYFRLSENKILLLPAGYLLICLVSTALSGRFSVAFFGGDGRYEGFIAAVSYVGIFAAASCLTDGKLRKALADVIIAVACCQSVIGVLQTIRPTRELLPSFFAENIHDETGVYSEYFVANGITGSPYTLAAVLTMAFALAANGFMHDDSKKKRIAYLVEAVLLCAGGLMTQNLAAVVGIAGALIISAVIEIARIKGGHGLFVKGIIRNPLGRWACVAVIAAATAVILKLLDLFSLNDSYIILNDSFNRLLLSMPTYPDAQGVKVYPHVWKEVLKVFKDHWVFGTGADCIALSVAEEPFNIAGLSDRAYNEYITMAASTGAVSLAFYAGFVISAAKRGANRIGKFFEKQDNWVSAGAFTACGAYLMQAFFSESAINSTPFFFLLMGLCFSAVLPKGEQRQED